MNRKTALRLSIILVILTMLSAVITGGTFAKYTTGQNGQDNARVAYWGFNQSEPLNIPLFQKEYDGGAVKSENDENLVAPGTSNKVPFGFRYQNNTAKNITAPEVAYLFEVKVETTGSNVDFLDANPNFYWTLTVPGGTEVEYQTLEALAQAIRASSGDVSGTKQYLPGQLPTGFTAGDNLYTVGWIWLYDETDAKANGEVNQDGKDTDLGNMDVLENVFIKITITATQVDKVN